MDLEDDIKILRNSYLEQRPLALGTSCDIVVFSSLEPNDDDRDVCGTKTDSTNTAHYLNPDVVEIVPDDGAPVTFSLPAKYRERVPPKHALSAKQVGHITRNITNAFRLEKRDNDKVADLESSIDEQYTRSFVTHAAQPIYQLTTTPSSAAELQASPSVQRAATAKAVIHELCSRDDEEDHIWVYQVGTGVSKSAVTDRGPEHHEVRVPNPAGARQT
ncbi:hypothetical protein H9Q72_009063 [Fusarium xylarioides]|uniref:Uncharacterized protein n=1 Tax=Fusarium xylarioides TaxID=221167 RepID=A0A9P7HLL3_9HYPO|nr:hypothetical protein H9Q72_009063 [Fusarium xylarioides]KAG5806895.1 hypothetical protein H9Q71_008539 [Fusarium xylarioides]KAG5818203.1 hypothetical protein H9Q74_010171 [Fusarium xylarioides]